MGSQLILVYVALAAVFYLFAIRPQQRARRAHLLTVKALKVGDEVLTGAGLIGEVTEIVGDVLYLEVQEGVELRVMRDSVVRVLDDQALAAVPERGEPGGGDDDPDDDDESDDDETPAATTDDDEPAVAPGARAAR